MHYETLKNAGILKVVRKHFQSWLIQEKKNQSGCQNHGKLYYLSCLALHS